VAEAYPGQDLRPWKEVRVVGWSALYAMLALLVLLTLAGGLGVAVGAGGGVRGLIYLMLVYLYGYPLSVATFVLFWKGV